MRVVLFSSNKKVKDSLRACAAKGRLELEIRPPSELAKSVKSLSHGCFVYFDVAGRPEAEIGRISRLLSNKGLPHGFIDPGDRIRDVALLFQLGASDFVGGRLLNKGMDPARIRRADATRNVPARTKTRKVQPNTKRAVLKSSKPKKPGIIKQSGQDVPPAASWGDIEEEREYLFCLMYIELDNLAELRKNLGEKIIILTVNTFREYVERSIAPHGGRLWMWNGSNGLALFPFDGSRCDAVTPCLRLMLAKRIFSAGLSYLSTSLSYSIALHIGGTVYRRKGDTGEIVSDALNSVFHLGRKYLKPGNFFITKAVYDRIPECLNTCFVEAGVFEGSGIMRMRLPR